MRVLNNGSIGTQVIGYGCTDDGEEFYFKILRHGKFGEVRINIGLILHEFEDDIVWDEVTA